MWFELFDFALLSRQTVSKAELNPDLDPELDWPHLRWNSL